MTSLLLLIIMAYTAFVSVTSTSGVMEMKADLTGMASDPIKELLGYINKNDYTVIFISDGSVSPSHTIKDIGAYVAPHGIGFFEVHLGDNTNHTDSSSPMARLLSTVRKLRRSSWTVLVVVISEDFPFIMAFSRWSLKQRLVGSETKLLAVTRITDSEVDQVLRSSWTFTMMDSMLLNLEGEGSNVRYSLYSHLPYSSIGKNQIIKLAYWRKGEKLSLITKLNPFPAKYENFHGHEVPVTALPFPPFWDEKKTGNGSDVVYSGTDFYLLDAIAHGHNFTIYVVPTKNWAEVLDKVEIRESFIASVFHAVLPMRLKRFDYSYVYEYSSVDFSFAKPEVKPQWQSLYYPLSEEVWISTLISLIVMAGLVTIFVLWSHSILNIGRLDIGLELQEMFGTLLGQSIPRKRANNPSRKVLLASWLLFSFILGTAYRGNLIAYLTIPKYPPRPENLKELLRVAEKITMPPYGKDFKTFFSQSDSKDFLKLARLLHIVPSINEGQKQAVEKRQGHLDTRRYQEQYIAQYYTRIDGSTLLYVAREGVLPGISAWPIPHDAPYTSIINRGQMAVLEAGLYEHWSGDLIEETKSETRRRLQEKQEEMRKEGKADYSTEGGKTGKATMALTIIHIQGPLMLILIGHVMALLTFLVERAIASKFALHE